MDSKSRTTALYTILHGMRHHLHPGSKITHLPCSLSIRKVLYLTLASFALPTQAVKIHNSGGQNP